MSDIINNVMNNTNISKKLDTNTNIDIINIIPKDYYYKQSVIETPNILENIKASELQTKYRQFMADFRNIDKQALDDSYMFYILDGYEELEEIIYSENIREMLGIQVGNFIKQKERFVFPILDAFKTILGFVGYDYENDKYKYLMTFSKFAEKNKIFFNMQNLNYAYKKDICIVQEGVFDSIRLNSTGYKNNLSLLGKRFTEFHARLLSRFSLVIFIGDNDDPGKDAVESWIKLLNEYNGIKKSNNFNYNSNLNFNLSSGNNLGKTKIATIYIKPNTIEKTIIDPETLEKSIITKKIKDIDDCLINKDNITKFNNIYKQIIKDTQNPLYSTKQYSL